MIQLKAIPSWPCAALVFALFATAPAGAAPAGKPAPPPAKPSGNPVTEFKTPLSVFVIPHSPAEGRDPFFPKSLRPYASGAPIVSSPTNPVPVSTIPTDIKFKGRSGTSDHPLAIINNHTFEPGEEAEITTGSGRIRVRCVEIRSDSVVIQVGNERREIHMRGEFSFPTARNDSR